MPILPPLSLPAQLPTAPPIEDRWVPSPIETRISRALAIPFFRFEPRGDLMTEGERSLTVSFTASNDLRLLPTGGPYSLIEDCEIERIVGRYRIGLRRGTELELDLPLLSRGGGFLDPIIDWWHLHVLGIHNERSDVPYGRSEVVVPGSGPYGSAAGIGDISATLSKTLTRRWTAAAAVKMPTGDAGRLLGSGAVDAGVSVRYRTALGPRWAFHGALGSVAQGRATDLRGSRDWVHQEWVAFTYQPNSRDGWIGQWQSEASALETGIAASDATHRTLSLGYQRKISSSQSIQAYFTEDGDFLNYRIPWLVDVGPDFGIGLNWSTKF